MTNRKKQNKIKGRCNMLTITLNVNDVNIPIKRQRQACSKKYDPTICSHKKNLTSNTAIHVY